MYFIQMESVFQLLNSDSIPRFFHSISIPQFFGVEPISEFFVLEKIDTIQTWCEGSPSDYNKINAEEIGEKA